MSILINQILALIATGSFATVAGFAAKLLHINTHNARITQLESYAEDAVRLYQDHESQVNHVFLMAHSAHLTYTLQEIEAKIKKFVEAAKANPVAAVQTLTTDVAKAAQEAKAVSTNPVVKEVERSLPSIQPVIAETQKITSEVSNAANQAEAHVGKIAPQATTIFESEATK